MKYNLTENEIDQIVELALRLAPKEVASILLQKQQYRESNYDKIYRSSPVRLQDPGLR